MFKTEIFCVKRRESENVVLTNKQGSRVYAEFSMRRHERSSPLIPGIFGV